MLDSSCIGCPSGSAGHPLAVVLGVLFAAVGTIGWGVLGRRAGAPGRVVATLLGCCGLALIALGA